MSKRKVRGSWTHEAGVESPSKVRKNLMSSYCHDDDQVNKQVKCSETSSDERPRANVQELKRLVDMYDNNKLTRQNVWENEIIDLFSHFCQRMNEINSDIGYRFVGQCIAAVTRVYTLRIDSLYEDVLRFSSFVGRHVNTRRNLDNAVDDTARVANGPVRARITKRVKRKETVVQNPECLNANLLTRPQLDPFFEMINTFVGEVTRPNRMLLNLLPSHRQAYSSRLALHSKMWKNADRDFEKVLLKSQARVMLHWVPDIRSSFVRLTNADFKITNESYDYYRYTTFVDLTSDGEEKLTRNNDAMDISTEGTVYEDFCNILDLEAHAAHTSSQVKNVPDMLNFSHLDSLETLALNPPKVVIDDMEPDSCVRLEYSYRPSEFVINQSCRRPNPRKNRPKALRRLTTIEDVRSFSKKCLLNAWDKEARKFLLRSRPRPQPRLPPDFNLNPDILEHFNNSDINLDDPILNCFEATNDDCSTITDSGDIGNSQDCSDFFNNILTSTRYNQDINNNAGGNNDFNSTIFNSFSKTLSTNHQTQTSLTFATKPRIFNIKKIKDLSLSIVEVDSRYGETETKFSSVYTKVSKMFEFTAESVSCSLTFLSILQAANEGKVEIFQDDVINDFTIKPLQLDEMSA